MHVAGGVGRVPRRARGDRDVRPLADRGRGPHQPRRARFATGACSRPADPAPTEAELAVCPAARSAHGLRARPEPPRRARCRASSATLRGARRASTWWRRREDGEAASCAADARRAALRARRRARRTCAGGELDAWRATRAALDLDVEDGRVTARPTRTRSARLWSALDVPALRRRARVGARQATSSSTGAAPTTSGGGSHGSLHRDDSRGRAAALRRRTPPERASSGRIDRRHRHWCSSTSVYRCTDERGARPRRHARPAPASRARARRPAQVAQLGAARQVLRRSAGPATSSTSASSPSASRPSACTTSLAATLAFVVGGDEQLLVEPPLDLPRAGPAAPASRRRASSRSASWRSCSRSRSSSCW